MEQVSSIAGSGVPQEVFALTDEQILEMEPLEEVAGDEWGVASSQDAGNLPGSLRSEPQEARLSGRDDNRLSEDGEGLGAEGLYGLRGETPRAQAGMPVPPERAWGCAGAVAGGGVQEDQIFYE